MSQVIHFAYSGNHFLANLDFDGIRKTKTSVEALYVSDIRKIYVA